MSSGSNRKDVFGNTYEKYLSAGSLFSVDASTTYRINGIYKTFTGAFFIDTTTTYSNPDSVSIYGDGVKLFDSIINGGEDPTTFNIDVTGIRDLTIEIEGPHGIYLGDPILTP